MPNTSKLCLRVCVCVGLHDFQLTSRICEMNPTNITAYTLHTATCTLGNYYTINLTLFIKYDLLISILITALQRLFIFNPDTLQNIFSPHITLKLKKK